MKINQYINKKDGKIYYKFQLYLGIDPITSKPRKTTRRGFKTKKEAELSYAKLITAVDTQGVTNNSIKTFNELYKLWYEGYQLTIKESSLNVMKSIYKVILSEIGDMNLKKITIPYCQSIINKWSISYSERVCKKLSTCISSILEYGIKLKIINDNPMKYTKIPKKDILINEEDKYYTKDELEKFLSIVERSGDIKVLAMFRVLAFTGMRKGELLGLQWKDIDFKNNIIDINKTLAAGSCSKPIIQTTKNKSSIRKITIDEKTKNTLKLWQVRQRELLFKLGIRVDKEQYCFTKELKNNECIRLNWLNIKLQLICTKNNFKKIKIHGFRHTHCSLLFESGASIQEVQYRLGHSDIKTTMSVYAHFTDTQKENTAIKFAKYVNF